MVRPFFLARDDFYDDPVAVRARARQMVFEEPDDSTGFHSTSVYHEPGVKAKLERILGVRITRWDRDPHECNGVFYQGFARGPRLEVPAVHADPPYDDITVVVYLTPGLPPECGTSLWMHRRTGLAAAPGASDARRLGFTLAELRARLERDSKRRARWIELDRAAYRFNRMVAYPSGLFHSATRHYGGSLGRGRIFQTFRLGVDWRTMRA